MRMIKTLGAAIMLGAVLVGPPWALIRFIGNPWPDEGVALSAPLTDGAIIGLLAAVVWVLWVQLVACIVAEAIAAVTDDRIKLRVPLTLPAQRHFARRLMTALVLVAVATPVVAHTAMGTTGPAPSPEPKTTPATSLTLASSRGETGTQTRGEDQEHASAAATALAQEHSTVTVMRLDSLWSIAERVLGEGDRWPEIAALNEGRTMSDGTMFLSADHIKPGWELHVPAGAHVQQDLPALEHQVVIETGDTLSQIALEELGDAEAYPAIFKANQDIVQSDGQRLVDPDLIMPGWTLQIPGQPAHTHKTNQQPDRGRESRQDTHAPPTSQPDDRSVAPGAEDGENRPEREQHRVPVAPATPAPSQRVPSLGGSTHPTSSNPEQTPAVGATAAEQLADEGGITALRALLAGAACLAVGALGLVAANRRRQVRRRRIGRTIASTPQELAELEQAILEHGSGAQDEVDFLDRALRHVAACCRAASNPLPQLGAAVLGDQDLTLLFSHPAVGEVPEGWTATEDARAWMLPRWTLLEQNLETQPAPYPALVSIGQDEAGRTWLLDLETLGVCGIGGEPEQVADLARFLVAELAVNAWSEGSQVLLADQFGSETIGLNPARLRQVDRSDALARAAVLIGEMGGVEQNLHADVLTRRRDGLLLDTTNPVVVVMAGPPEGEFVAALKDRDRSRIVVVHRDQETPAVELTGEGMAFLPMWGISVRAFTLRAGEAEAMAALLALTRNVEDEPVPAAASDGGRLGKYARMDGSLREEYTEPRRTEGNDPSSLLPDSDEVYMSAAATTPEDMAAVAPSVPEETRAEIDGLDRGLGEDLADWFEESSPRPKVRLLGSVDVTALNGGNAAMIDNLAGTISFIAYLACQERGVTGERAAEACGWKTQKTVQNRATNARFLLGTRPDGSDWLPDASTSDGARRGTPTYELGRGAGGVLVDIDLFVRLRFRAQRRGDDGCEADLETALSLVNGAPFEAATDRRFPWLFKGQRHDDIMVAAIHDVAHVLATRAVAAGRTDLVRLACEAARRANPHSDVAWLDMAAAAEAESGRDAADELVREQVVDRFDEDLPTRTEAVLDQRDWLTG